LSAGAEEGAEEDAEVGAPRSGRGAGDRAVDVAEADPDEGGTPAAGVAVREQPLSAVMPTMTVLAVMIPSPSP
jgi:hypothetical protein